MARNALIQLRRDTAANWTSTNPTLASGEMGFETDTNLFKIGDGSTLWTSLLYAVTPPQTFTYKVGDTGPGGGIIFFVDRYDEYAGFTYLEVAPSSTEVQLRWAPGANPSLDNTAVTGADSKALGAGYQNTIDIVAQNPVDPTRSAGLYCSNLVSGGQSDWYLGSIAEMNLVNEVVYLQLSLGGFNSNNTSFYWSSSEASSGNAWGQSFGTGAQTLASKGNVYSVRPVRRF
jgi:hypothetical protein